MWGHTVAALAYAVAVATSLDLLTPLTRKKGFLRVLVHIGGLMVKGVVLAGLGAAFVLRLVSRSLRTALRLVFTLRAI